MTAPIDRVADLERRVAALERLVEKQALVLGLQQAQVGRLVGLIEQLTGTSP